MHYDIEKSGFCPACRRMKCAFEKKLRIDEDDVCTRAEASKQHELVFEFSSDLEFVLKFFIQTSLMHACEKEN